jgi:hypothetical protein
VTPRALVVLAAAVAACAPPAASPAAPPIEARVAPPAWQVRGAGGRDPIDVGTADPALVDAAGCVTCHAAIGAEWARSRHALAWTNGIFQREFQHRPQAWCINCHAPMPVQQAGLASGDHALADQGVSCATCHVRGGRIVAARRGDASPHDTVVEPSFGSPAFCADCHEFTFPVFTTGGAARAMTAHPMQDTVTAFRAGPFARERDGCLTCHGSARDHAFPGAHDAEMLAAAFSVDWCRRGDALEVAITNIGAGHHIPTGDIHRHANLRVWRSSAPEALFEVFLGRRFAPAPGGGKTTTWDSRIAPGTTVRHAVAIAELGGEPDEPLNLDLTYVFIADEFPRPRNAPSEPAATSIVRRRAAVAEVAACTAIAGAPQTPRE